MGRCVFITKMCMHNTASYISEESQIANGKTVWSDHFGRSYCLFWLIIFHQSRGRRRESVVAEWKRQDICFSIINQLYYLFILILNCTMTYFYWCLFHLNWTRNKLFQFFFLSKWVSIWRNRMILKKLIFFWHD